MIERPQWYSLRFNNPALVAGARQLYTEITLDSDAQFRMTGVALYVFSNTGAALGPSGNVGITVQWTMPDLTWVQKHITSAQMVNPFDGQAVNGAAGQTAPYYAYFSPLGKNILYPNAASIVVDIAQLAGITDALIMIVFCGTKLFGDNTVWWPLKSSKNPVRPYIGYSVQFNTSALPILNLPFNVNPDADFAWQYGSQTDNPVGTLAPVGSQRAIGIKFKDWTGKYYMNDFIPLDLIFGFDNSQTPGLVYPEIYIPKNQGIYLDLKVLP